MKRLLCIVFIATCLCACTSVQIQEAGGATRVERGFGFLALHIEPGANPVLAKVTTLGFGHSLLGTSLGYSSQELALIPPDCRVVLWIDNAEQLEQVRTILAGVEQVCPVLMQEKTE